VRGGWIDRAGWALKVFLGCRIRSNFFVQEFSCFHNRLFWSTLFRLFRDRYTHMNICTCICTYKHLYIFTFVRARMVDLAIKGPRTRSTAARQVSNAHEQDLGTNQNV